MKINFLALLVVDVNVLVFDQEKWKCFVCLTGNTLYPCFVLSGRWHNHSVSWNRDVMNRILTTILNLEMKIHNENDKT